MKILRQTSRILAFLCIGAVPAFAESVTIFAASSLKTALDRVIAENDLDAIAVYGGSAALARQVAHGADADVVIFAHRDWMDWLETQNAITAKSRCDVTGNRLVLAGPVDGPLFTAENAKDIIDALEGGRLAVGQLSSVPAGQYTAQYLTNRGWLEPLRPHLAETSNVRLALALLARAEVPLAFVYASDVFAEDRVQMVFKPDPSEYPAIRYPMALTATANAQSHEVARRIMQSSHVFMESGFAGIPKNQTEWCQ